jgi:hemerythrin
MLTAWRDDMATGNEAVDGQHRELLKKVDDLLQACREQRVREEIAQLLWFLKRYVRVHFRDEEKLQLESCFPGYPAHKAQHDAFYHEVLQLEARYAREGASPALIVESVHLMCEWLHLHFNDMDCVLVEFLRNGGSEGSH